MFNANLFLKYVAGLFTIQVSLGHLIVFNIGSVGSKHTYGLVTILFDSKSFE